MRLRTQLILVSLLTLALPWAGWQLVRESESALRTGQAAALEGAAQAIAGAMAGREALGRRTRELAARASEGQPVYAHALAAPVEIDGYADDWNLAVADYARPVGEDGEAQLLAGADRRFAYLFLSVRDEAIRYEQPGGGGNADRLRLTIERRDGSASEYLLSTGAPGPTLAAEPARPGGWLPGSGREPRIQANWQETAAGFNVEVRLPLALLGLGLGLERLDVDEESSVRRSGTFAAGGPPGPLILPDPIAAEALEEFAQRGWRLRFVAPDGWIVGEAGSLQPAVPGAGGEPGLIEQIYRALLIDQRPDDGEREPGRLMGTEVQAALTEARCASRWRTADAREAAIVSAACTVELGDGVQAGIVIEQTTDAILTLTDKAVARLVGTSMTATVVAAIGLLGFATWLSIRIRRLRNAAERALSPEGEISASFPETGTRDELGDLARSFTSLLGRLRDYTAYLRSLASKLTHELRNPLAVVQSSLENLEHETLSAEARVYAARARDGILRLGHMIRALGEATRTEQAIASATSEQLDLAALVRASADGYRDAFTGRQFSCATPDGTCSYTGTPELIVQMLDKLVDNAVEFSPRDGRIEIRLSREAEAYSLSVDNDGPPLPERMRGQLFDSMVSVREGTAQTPHLGLGLYIVRLIAAHHGGTAAAANRPGGVVFSVRLPRRRE